jgi:hypothetical protein
MMTVGDTTHIEVAASECARSVCKHYDIIV